ncbi:hypothetical protein [Streptomyces canus]|nr:hypothetical protein [Streptomyces canus]
MRLLALGLAGLTPLAGHEPAPPLSAEPTLVSTGQIGPPRRR